MRDFTALGSTGVLTLMVLSHRRLPGHDAARAMRRCSCSSSVGGGVLISQT